MKKIVTNLLYASIIGVYFISAFNVSAQNNKVTNYTAEEKKSIKEKNTIPQNNGSGQLPLINVNSCGDMGVENGWSGWQASIGDYRDNGNSSTITYSQTNFSPTLYPTRFVMTTGGGTDACTAGLTSPPISVVAPGFGNRSIQLGARTTTGTQGGCNQGCVERLTYTFTVTKADTNLIYAYAFVFNFRLNNQGQPDHTGAQVPYTEIYILDAKGDTVTCSHQKYMGDTLNQTTPTPGLYPTVPACAFGDAAKYKPWTVVGVNLGRYVGSPLNPLTIHIVNADCSQGGHYCHSYWDFMCPPLASNSTPFCQGQQTTMSAPLSSLVSNQYSYQWYINTKPYNPNNHWTIISGATGANYSTIPQVGDTFSVHVHQPSGCDFWIPFNPQIMSITPNFTSIGSCGIVNFIDKSTTPDGSAIIKWNWNFGGGIPNTSTVQNPSGIHYLPGTYSVTLIATSVAGCVDTIVLPVTITAPPIAAFKSNVVCFNNPTAFNNLSTGTPMPTQWAWDFGDSNTSALQNPTHTYGSPGSFTVTLIATDANGCKSTIKHPVFINPLPVANFSSNKVCFGNPTCFKNLSTISSGSITGLSWSFGDPNSGANNISTLPTPCHTFTSINNFSVTLTVTSDSGCQSTIVLPVAFSPPPVALFSSIPVCLNVPTNFISTSTSSATDPINTWSWSFGDGSNSNMPNPTHMYTAGSYTATLIVTTVGGCKDTINEPVTVHPLPIANFSKPDSGCSPIWANYTDLSTSADGIVSSWQWSFPGGSPLTSTIQNPKNIKYTIPGAYNVSLIVTTIYGCMDTIKLPMIEVYPWPKAEFCVTPSVAPATAPVFNFCDMWSKDVVKWVWNFGDSSPLDSTNTNPVHSYSATVNQNDFYTKQICIQVQNQYGCWDTVCHTVELIPEFTFYIPNTFTPNGDNINEMFYGKCRGVKEYDIWLFDRWGNQIWDCHRKDKNTNWDNDLTNQEGLSSYCKWDGIVVRGGIDMSGNSRQLAQEDVYVWKVKLLDIFNKYHTYIGHVNIVR